MAAALLAPATVVAQSWPARPVRIIVPYAPGGTSPQLVRRLYTEAVRGLGAADVRERLEKSGNEYVMSPPEDFVVFLRGEIAKWTKVVREANLRLE